VNIDHILRTLLHSSRQWGPQERRFLPLSSHSSNNGYLLRMQYLRAIIVPITRVGRNDGLFLQHQLMKVWY
jgi:hypothetical protein